MQILWKIIKMYNPVQVFLVGCPLSTLCQSVGLQYGPRRNVRISAGPFWLRIHCLEFMDHNNLPNKGRNPLGELSVMKISASLIFPGRIYPPPTQVLCKFRLSNTIWTTFRCVKCRHQIWNCSVSFPVSSISWPIKNMAALVNSLSLIPTPSKHLKDVPISWNIYEYRADTVRRITCLSWVLWAVSC